MTTLNDAAPTRETLYLIDGHAQIFRAYYAIRGGMTSPVTGEPTGACFAFTGMLLKLMSKFRPHYVAMAIDTPGKTFRDELYPEYKANRESPPEDFAAQVPRIFEITRMFGIPIIGQPGAEADDLIATITQRILDDPQYADIDLRIVSKDKDLEQLLTDRVSMFDIHTDTTIDVDALLENKGITPEQVIDILTLTGDTVDNIPGVKGVGPKTAVKLIQEFGSVQGVLDNIDKIKGKRKENIQEAAEFLPLSRKLVTLDHDVDIEFDLGDAKVGGIDATSLRHLFRQLGFNRHIDELNRLVGADETPAAATAAVKSKGDAFPTSLFDAGNEGRASGQAVEPIAEIQLAGASDCEYEAITTREQLDELVDTLSKQKLIAFDTETIGLGHRMQMCGLSFAWKPKHGVYIPTCSPDSAKHLDLDTVLAALKPMLENADLPKCAHNFKYDMLVLRNAGIHVHGIAFDSMIGAFLVGTPGHGLDHLALSLLKHETIPITKLIGPGGRGKTQLTMDKVPLEQITPYAAEDADITLRLTELLQEQVKEMGMEALARDVEMPLIDVLAEMEYQGIRVDPDVLDEQKQQLSERIIELRDQIHEAAGEPFNIDSPKQLAEVLFTKLGLPVIKRTKTGPSTDVEVLDRLCEMEDLEPELLAVPRLVVEYRQLTKLVGTYLESLKTSIEPDTGRIHASFHQTGTATGRLSSSGPNLQNIPIRTDIGRQIRKAFIADPEHVLISADYSQIELRILAHLSEDEALIDAFKRDLDIHTAVAAQVFGVDEDSVSSAQRSHAKVINFGIIYGVTPFGLARRIEGLDVGGARKLIDDYRTRFPGINRFLDKCINQALTEGHVITMLGRRREIPQINSSNGQTRALGERLAINTVVQGSAADLIKVAMVNLHRKIQTENLPARLLLQIHDELVVEAPVAKADEMAKLVQQEMENAIALTVPLKVELGVGPDWLSAK